MLFRSEDSPISPLWSRYKDNGENTSTRTLLHGSLSYKPIRNLDITARLSFDQNNYNYDGYSVPRFDDSVILPNAPKSESYATPELFAIAQKQYNDYYNSVPYFSEEKISSVKTNVDTRDLFGSYLFNNSKSDLVTASLMANYKIELNSDFTIEMLAGSEIKSRNSISAAMKGRDFIIPGIYSMYNVNEVQRVADASVDHRQIRNAGKIGRAHV